MRLLAEAANYLSATCSPHAFVRVSKTFMRCTEAGALRTPRKCTKLNHTQNVTSSLTISTQAKFPPRGEPLPDAFGRQCSPNRSPQSSPAVTRGGSGLAITPAKVQVKKQQMILRRPRTQFFANSCAKEELPYCGDNCPLETLQLKPASGTDAPTFNAGRSSYGKRFHKFVAM